MIEKHRARRLVLQALCCLDVQGLKAKDLVNHFISESDETVPTIQSAQALLNASYADLSPCDEFLARHARRWDLSRLALVDRNILRLAVHELRNRATPMQIIISEALKLAEEFSSAESPRFVNGVLDAVAKEIAGKEEE